MAPEFVLSLTAFSLPVQVTRDEICGKQTFPSVVGALPPVGVTGKITRKSKFTNSEFRGDGSAPVVHDMQNLPGFEGQFVFLDGLEIVHCPNPPGFPGFLLYRGVNGVIVADSAIGGDRRIQRSRRGGAGKRRGRGPGSLLFILFFQRQGDCFGKIFLLLFLDRSGIGGSCCRGRQRTCCGRSWCSARGDRTLKKCQSNQNGTKFRFSSFQGVHLTACLSVCLNDCTSVCLTACISK